MRVIFFIIIGIFLFFTAPIWVPIVGVLGLVGVGRWSSAGSKPVTLLDRMSRL